jgi:hypothetical protein
MTKDEALRLALEALENLFGIPDKWTGEGGGDVAVWRLGGSYRAQEAIKAIKAALLSRSDGEAKDKPVGIAGELFSNTALERLDLRPSTGIYITPLKRTWVGLTDEEKDHLFNMYERSSFGLVLAVEAKLKEKNNV